VGRGVVGGALGGGAALAWPEAILGLERLAPLRGSPEYWSALQAEFLIPDDRIYLNVGTLGAQPRVVVDAVVEHTRRVAETYPPRIDWDALKSQLGGMLRADPRGFVFPRNTTEAMSFVANGLDWSAGDEILTTHHEHIGGRCCWELIAARYDVRLHELALPPVDEGPEAVVEVFRRAMTPHTRVLSVSHVTFTNGRVLPVAALAALCRERGVVCVIDGAHPPGLIPVDLDAFAEAGVDFYASSPHKWLLAPQGTGMLWMAERWRTELWPTLASGGWDDLELGAHRFNHLGSLDESRLAGLVAALAFFDEVGLEAAHARIRTLRRRLIDGLRDVRGLRITSPTDDVFGAGMVSFTLGGVAGLDLQRELGGSDKIRTRVISEFDLGWMRLSPHIYNGESDIDTAIARIAAVAARG
jgi:isopenicillin-N epimerase